ncbi:Inosine triphosphate pyrophosphatase [Pseudoloma neurophilia]|uniref:Inosine triphosphate pyrophosphatase n=1 Tax=Pseudoloma neurophilia TaxID=146866 RepID=A0A0R0M4R6_9MICR|nr:Inosine triphosphate pyrophosphatase [Pseudoloma neurophilia]
MKIYFVTSNRIKYEYMTRNISNHEIIWIKHRFSEKQKLNQDFITNKLREAHSILSKTIQEPFSVFVEDRLICLQSLARFPPIHIKDPNNLNIFEKHEIIAVLGRKAYKISQIAIYHRRKTMKFLEYTKFTTGINKFGEPLTHFDQILKYKGQKLKDMSHNEKEQLDECKKSVERLSKHLDDLEEIENKENLNEI